MASEVSLQSKYERLCAEFLKLRKKHNEYRDSVSKQVAELKKSEKEKSDRLNEIERQYEELRYRLGSRGQLSESPNEFSSSALDLLPFDSTQSASTISKRTTPFAVEIHTQACQTDPASSIQTNPIAPDCAIPNLTNALQQWLDAILSNSRKSNLSESQSFLLKRISELECEVARLSADLHLERKRHVTKDIESYDTDQLPTLTAADHLPVSERDALMLDFLRSRVESNVEQAQYASSVASFLQDELRSVVPHLSCLARELHDSRATVERLTAELESLQLNTAKQNDAMAQHMVNLTEELQQWRCSGRNHSNLAVPSEPVATRFKKNSLSNVLKR